MKDRILAQTRDCNDSRLPTLHQSDAGIELPFSPDLQPVHDRSGRTLRPTKGALPGMSAFAEVPSISSRGLGSTLILYNSSGDRYPFSGRLAEMVGPPRWAGPKASGPSTAVCDMADFLREE